MMLIDRRNFLKQSGMVGLGVGLSTVSMPSAVKAAANDTVVAAIIGIRSRGRQLTREFAGLNNCRVKYVVDVDSRYLANPASAAEEAQGQAPTELTDFRRALDDNDVDVVVIAAPDHWHTPMTILALKAGKHVYVEKPASHNPAEGEMLVQAQEKYGKLVQMGNQRRSTLFTQQMISDIRDGIIGNVYKAKTWYASNRQPIGFGEQVPVPDYLNWDLFQGPAPHVPYRSNVHPYNWHWFWHWGTGESLNNGTHHVDVARWALGVNYPKRVASLGGRWHYVNEDDWECPDTQSITIEYEEGKMITWEGRSCNRFRTHNHAHGVALYGTEGTIIYEPFAYAVYDERNQVVKKIGTDGTQIDPTDRTDPGLRDNHAENFVEAVLGNGTLASPVDEGQKSVLPLHLANIALRTGSVIECDPKSGRIIGNLPAQKLWQRTYEPKWAPTL